jgi:hypothetical protein
LGAFRPYQENKVFSLFLFAVRRAGQRLDIDLHQPLGGEGDHLAQNIGVGVFSTSEGRFIISVAGWSSQRDPSPEIVGDHRKPARSLQRYQAARFASGFAPASCTTTTRDTTRSRC